MTVQIYEARTAGLLMQKLYEVKKKKNPKFSTRAWARKLGMKNNTPLSLMMSGKRPVPRKLIPVLAKDSSFNKKETLFLETLVELSHSKSLNEKVYLEDRLRFLTPGPKLDFIEVEPFECFDDPLHGIILSLINLKDFRHSYSWMKEQLIFDVSEDQLKAAFERLIRLKLIKKNSDSKWVATSQNIFHKPYTQSIAFSSWHKRVISLASYIGFDDRPGLAPIEEGVINPNKDISDLQAYTLALPKSRLPGVLRRVREFCQEIINECEITQPDQLDEVYQFNLQFVPLTKPKRKL